MSAKPALFTEAEVRRAINGARKAGFALKSVDILRNGTIRLVPVQDGGGETGDLSKKVDLG